MTQLTKMLDCLLKKEVERFDVLECYFIEALYCSLGACLLEDARIKFDDYVKRLASMSTVETPNVFAGPGELPGTFPTSCFVF